MTDKALRRFAAVLTLVAAATFTQAVVATPAAQAAGCDVHIGVTHKVGTTIFGYGSLANCEWWQRGHLEIQRWTGLWWDDGPDGTVYGPGYDQYITRSCAGTGTQTWRTRIWWKQANGWNRQKESELRVSC